MESNFKLRIIGLIALCMMTFVTVQAQPQFGFRAGVNISKQQFKQGNLTIEPKSKFGLDLALTSNFPLGEVVSFSPELHWLQKGYKLEDINQNGSATLNYIEVPLLIKFNFGETAKFFVMGGPSIGYLLGGKVIVNDVEQENFLEFVNRLELGAHLGAGFAVGLAIIDIRYILGISNISDIPDAEVRNTSFGAGVGVMF